MNKPAPDQPLISDVAVIGDQGTCALIDKRGTIVWYCPWRFDQPSLFSLLIDTGGGYWSITAPGCTFQSRHYQNDTAILETHFSCSGGSFSVVDFMPRIAGLSGICRMVAPAPVAVTATLHLTPNYNRSRVKLKKRHDHIVIDTTHEIYVAASHPVVVDEAHITVHIPAGEMGWMALVNEKEALSYLSYEQLAIACQQTKQSWEAMMEQVVYTGVYKQAFYQSYKAILLMSHTYSGGIIAAATTSLPEVPGGSRNYDYRYVWLRDTAMVVSALIRAESKGSEAEHFLDFLRRGRNTNKKDRFVPFYDLDSKTAPDEVYLPGTGYRGATPLRMGNNAFEQLQLDAQGNVLLAAKQIYQRKPHKPHWHMVQYMADYLVANWQRKDHGIWEEHLFEHFTSSKVIVAKSLEFIADYADSDRQKQKWLNAAKDIRAFIARYCLTADGAYAVYAGSNEVDVTAALYPVWLYDEPGSPAMLQTIKRIEAGYKEGDLYHRRLELSDSKEEGVFLAASLWMAQYYVMLNELQKAKSIIDAVLSFASDLGFMPEEGDIATGHSLGNIPQTFVHASLMGVILDYNKAIKEKEN